MKPHGLLQNFNLKQIWSQVQINDISTKSCLFWGVSESTLLFNQRRKMMMGGDSWKS